MSFNSTIEKGVGKLLGGKDVTAMLNASIPLGRHARADEIARSAVYLASDSQASPPARP